MSSLVTNLNSISDWLNSRRMTLLDFAVGKFVSTCRDCRQLIANSVHTVDAT